MDGELTHLLRHVCAQVRVARFGLEQQLRGERRTVSVVRERTTPTGEELHLPERLEASKQATMTFSVGHRTGLCT